MFQINYFKYKYVFLSQTCDVVGIFLRLYLYSIINLNLLNRKT